VGGRPRLRRPEPRDYAINRYYSPETGRFTTHDPLTELDRPERLNQPQGLNLYPYVMGAPTRYSDPDGRDWWYRGEPEGSDWYLEWRDDDRTHIGEIGLAAMGFKRVTENQLFKAAYKQLGNDIVALNPSVRTFEIAFSKPPEVGPIGGIRLPAMEFPLAECVSVGLQMMSVIQDPRLARIVADTTVETGVAIVTYPKRMVKSLVGLPEALKTGISGDRLPSR